MRGFLLGAAVVAAVVTLVSASMNTTTLLPTVNDLPLAHASNARFPQVSRARPLLFTMPPTTGFVLTYWKPETSTDGPWEIWINGQCVRAGAPTGLGTGGWYNAAGFGALPSNPPIIVPPAGTLEIRLPGSSVTYACELGGYFISATDLGR
ncbi:MAG: hypothetical protein JXQ29_16765 [Planctomycetes bacterium]|nr:hypothetical protein [Planctomycetota bacterium]